MSSEDGLFSDEMIEKRQDLFLDNLRQLLMSDIDDHLAMKKIREGWVRMIYPERFLQKV